MNNFWSLVGFEYKKIFVRKSVLIALLLALIATIFSVFALVMGNNPNTETSNYEEMLIDKEYSFAFSGKPLDGRLILEASKAYQTLPDGVYPDSDNTEYEKYTRPYRSIYTLIDSAYAEPGNGFDIKDLQELSEEDANRFYEKRIQQYRIHLENNPSFTKKNVDRIIEADNQVQKPFIMEYTGGYERFFSFSTTNAFIVMFLIAFILSPMFVNEYTQRTDSLILTYNFTMLEVAILLFVTTLLGGFLMTGICFYLSSAMNNSVVVLAVSVTVVLLGMFNGIFPSLIEKIRYFLPSPMGTYFDVILNQYSWTIFGIDIWLYQAVCVVAFAVSSLLLVLTYCNFKRHQIK